MTTLQQPKAQPPKLSFVRGGRGGEWLEEWAVASSQVAMKRRAALCSRALPLQDEHFMSRHAQHMLDGRMSSLDGSSDQQFLESALFAFGAGAGRGHGSGRVWVCA